MVSDILGQCEVATVNCQRTLPEWLDKLLINTALRRPLRLSSVWPRPSCQQVQKTAQWGITWPSLGRLYNANLAGHRCCAVCVVSSCQTSPLNPVDRHLAVHLDCLILLFSMHQIEVMHRFASFCILSMHSPNKALLWQRFCLCSPLFYLDRSFPLPRQSQA